MVPFEVVEDGVIWRGDGESLYVQAWGRNSFRVRSVIMGDFVETGFSLLPQEAMAPTVSVGETLSNEGEAKVSVDHALARTECTVQNGKIKARLRAQTQYHEARQYTVHTCHLQILNSDDEVLLDELGDGGALQLRARHFQPQAGSNFRLTMSFESLRGEKLYGMGQYQSDVFDLKGSTLELAQRNSQASVPFLLSSKGYGFLWHNPAIGRATFGTNRTVWEAESTKQLDYWVTAGDAPSEIAEAYADATGHAPTMPEYGLGYWQCKLMYWNQEQLLEVAREHHRRGIPVDVIVADYFHWPQLGDFRFDPEFWPDPRVMVDELKEMGIELMVSVWPQVAHDSENFNDMRARGLTVRTERGLDYQMAFESPSVFADFTNPATRDYVWRLCKKNYYDLGIRIFWLDEAEPEYGIYDFDDYRYHRGTDLEVGNVYPLTYAQAFFEGQVSAGQHEVVNLLRCAWSGSQRYGALIWSGDIHSTWEAFRSQVVAGLHVGIAGIPWFTTDIGGFYGGDQDRPGFKELLVRWFQFGTFCPVMRMHGNREPYEAVYGEDGYERCRSGADNEVWSFGPDVEEILIDHIRLRERLRPYIREIMDRASSEGGPIMRPLFYDFPNDPQGWDIADQYMFGSDLLVAPVMVPGATSRSVYLPKGSSWRDVYSGQEYEGGQRMEVDAPIERMPVFARSGSLEDIQF